MPVGLARSCVVCREPPRLRSGRLTTDWEARCKTLRFGVPRSVMAKRVWWLLFDQGIISVSMDNSIPSQKKNARTIEASSAPSQPHSSFVGSRFWCQVEAPCLESAERSGMSIFLSARLQSSRM